MKNNNWIGKGVWEGWKFEGDKLISPSNRAYGPDDIDPDKYTQSDLARALGVTRAAVRDRLLRGTLPPQDGDGYWTRDIIKHVFK